MGTHTLAAVAAKSTGASSSSFLLILLVFAVLMIFMFRSQRRRRQQSQDTQRQVMDGTRIRTVHGIYGTVVGSDDRNVMVEIAPGVQVKLLRQAIAAVVPDEEPDGTFDTMPDTGADEKPSSHGERTDLSI